MDGFREARLRSNAGFRLVPFDKLGARERRIFKSLSEEPDFYGLLMPPAGSMAPIKSVSRDAALLFLTLREPACVPHLLDVLFAGNAEDRIRQLILDGVFEIEHAGAFVSGAEAAPLLGGIALPATTSRVAHLSLEAIRYALALEGLTPGELAGRLYLFNRAPGTRRIEQQLDSDERLLEFLVGRSAAAQQLDGWTREGGGDAWFMWSSPAPQPHLDFKLYVSPMLENLPEAFRVAVDAFAQVRCSHFKVGRTAFGLVRPDKLVAYFHDLEQLQEAAELIRASASGMLAQGVPFTASIDAEGLVSWGMDPPRFEQVLTWQQHQSWRQWVAERVAVYTIAAREARAAAPLDLVLQRVGLDGIDYHTWAPSLAIWRGRAGSEEEVA